MAERKHKSDKAQNWTALRAAERPLVELPVHGKYRFALAYANTYHVGMSSLGFQRVHELVGTRPDWASHRFFAEDGGRPLSVETHTPLDEYGCVAFSVSFEEDYIRLIQMLDRSSIPARRENRRPGDPVIVLGGSCATINPLTMAEFVDIFPLGAAENVLPALLSAFEEETHRDAIIERLAAEPGFFVPRYHRPEEHTGPEKLKKLELKAEQMRQPGHLPTTAIVTPHTEFSEKFLVEMSRGCPEKCRYCWATFGMGKFRWHPTDYILEAMERAREVTNQVGFVATAVGDHPKVEHILRQGVELGFRTSVSSIRIPAVTEGVLDALYQSGGRSITLAPETGTDELRAKMGKPIKNELLLEKIRASFRRGLPNLKLYFIVGLPDETLDDVYGILELAAKARSIMLEELARKHGVIGHIHLGASVLVPKPFTPWQRHAMDDPRSVKQKLSILKKGAGQLPNVSLSTGSYRQSVWQTYISRAGMDAADAIERHARGQHLSAVLREFDDRIRPEVFQPIEGDLRWHFMATG